MRTIKRREDVDPHQRRFFGAAALAVAAARLGIDRPAHAQTRKGLPTIKPGVEMSLGPLKQIHAGILNIGYAEAGPATGPAVILLPGGVA